MIIAVINTLNVKGEVNIQTLSFELKVVVFEVHL